MLEKLRSLQAQERSMASFAELNPAPVLSFNEKGEILIANPSSARLFDRRQLIGLEVWELFAGLSKLDIRSTIREGRILNYSARIADRHYQFVIKGIPDLLVGQMYGSDVTELMQAQSEAARAKERAEVKARQLVETVKELKLFNKLSVDREMRMIQLKQEINREYRCQGKLDKYNLSEIKSLPAEIEV
jgi:PAS domain-containing protein